jgi:4-diphosphocytidyl-2-C-methyl-D-erythritol kinase
MPVRPVTVRSPAKVNVALLVGKVREDGFHSLATIYQAVDLHDDVRAKPAPAGSITVSVSGEEADRVPTDESNLAVRAARLLADVTGVDEGVSLTILKRIPVAGGMAGGSTDAAAALLACDTLWETRLSRDDLMSLAAQLGSDVPFCLVGGTAVGSGRGEVLSPALVLGEYHWVFAFSDRGLSTPDVFAELDRRRRRRKIREPEIPAQVLAALRAGNPTLLGEALVNEMQPIALSLRPELVGILAVGNECEPLGAVVSGAGPTVLFLAANTEHAHDIADAVAASGLVRGVDIASGPVGGSRVIG